MDNTIERKEKLIGKLLGYLYEVVNDTNEVHDILVHLGFTDEEVYHYWDYEVENWGE